MVRLVGRKADGWIPSVPRLPLDEVAPRQRAIDEAARAAGRDPASIRRIANVNGLVTDGPASDFLDGPVDHWVETLVSMSRDHGFDGFVLWPKEDPLGQTERFGREVVPAVRAELARA
jgi:alkanesulfonate monooxygenase SsuD/methylene tetrahydromethanopterin reductase-like flavin-dependent oxidoreductase (luciferase family)